MNQTKQGKIWRSLGQIVHHFGQNEDSQQTSQSADSQSTDMHRVDRLRKLLSAGVVAACLILLVAPIVILYICKLSKAQSIGVVVAFAVLFIIVISQVPGAKTDRTLVGASAYLAVLVTFIANLQNSNCQMNGQL